MEQDLSHLSGPEAEDHRLLVTIRVRPMNKKELANQELEIIRPEEQMIIVLDPVEQQFLEQDKQMLDVLHRSKEQRYAFDRVFTNETPE